MAVIYYHKRQYITAKFYDIHCIFPVNLMCNLYHKRTFMTYTKLTILLLLSATACTPKSEIKFDFGNIGNDTLLIDCKPFSHADDFIAQTSDTLLIDSNGILKYSLPAKKPCIVSVKPFATSELIPGGRRWVGDRMINLYVTPNDRIVLKSLITKDGDVEFTIKGNHLNRKIQEVNKQILVFQNRIQETAIQMNHAYSDNNNTVLDSLKSVLNDVKNDYTAFISKCFHQRVNSEEAPYIILLSPADSVESYLAQIPQSTLNGMFKPLLEQARKKAEESLSKNKAKNDLTIGATAPDFTLPSIDGKDVTLSTLRGKTVLLDFWGTWCYACIKGIPDLKKVSEKYGNRLVILSIDCKDDKDTWIKNVEKYGMEWINVREDDSLPVSQKPTVRYNVTYFPTKIILDVNGRIQDISVGEYPEFYDKLDTIINADLSFEKDVK